MKPNDCRGKDARVIAIAELSRSGNINYGSYEYLDAATWTSGDICGGTGFIPSFIDFADLHSIPQGATIRHLFSFIWSPFVCFCSPWELWSQCYLA
tara:strand:- start:34 stop:321 length:288 start_codon:yes stop_codon:yes gene_type:complete